MPNKAKKIEERAAAHREAVNRSYRRNHDANKEKARVRMAEKRTRLKKEAQEKAQKTRSPSPESPAATHLDAEDDELTDIDQAINKTRFSSPAEGSVSGEEAEHPTGQNRRHSAPDDTRFLTPVAASVSGEEDELTAPHVSQDDQGCSQGSRWDGLPGLSYDEFPAESVLEQISYDLDEEVEIAEELLGSKGFQAMIAYNTREAERLNASGVRLLTSRK